MIMTVEPEKVAIVTGGSGGMGLAVARALAAQGGWKINLIDIKDEEGRRAADSLPNTTFHKTNLTNYEEMTETFKKAFTAGNNRLDFVFANAGVVEKSNIFAEHDSVDGPPPPEFTTLDVNLKSCINTVHVARHYLRLSPSRGSIVINASCSSFWPTYWAPIYTASKFGIMGFMRSVADHYKHEGIRVNALCPGAVRTPIIPDEAWKALPDDVFTPLELISEVVLKLAVGEELVDARGLRVTPDDLFGQAVVANGKNFYIQPEPTYCDDVMARTVQGTKLENQTAI